MRPGKVAQTGLDAARPLLESISDLMGWIAFFENFIQIACLLFAWALVILAFFILAIQLFVTLIEFKLATLAGFVLIPFGLFGKTAFMAEQRARATSSPPASRCLVLAVIIGIGSTLFSQFTAGFGGQTPTIDDAMAIVLAALSLLGLGIFGPGIANGLVSRRPAARRGRCRWHRPCRGRHGARRRCGAAGAAMLAAKGGAAALSGGAAAVRGGADRRRRGFRGLQPRFARPVRRGRCRFRPGRCRARGGLRRHLAARTRRLRAQAESVESSFSDGAKAGSARPAARRPWARSAVQRRSRRRFAPASIPTAHASGLGAANAAPPGPQPRHPTTTAHAVRSGDSHGSGSSVNLSESDRS